ncbi:hypothetical protein BV898_10950 [Hypsibius exemplaris]|uniref:Apple domain-containing protein n=1 Tax=Hypsibius exemplaris TaxID=2072580 RepID=A0A1W0WIA9_HYPEX|nr:hypothetical protein BV898_10950 [Hypsibius exemplaris]
MKSGPVTKADAFKIDGYPNVRCGLPDAKRVLTVSGWKVRGIFMFELDASQSSQNCLERCRTIPGCVLISWHNHFGCFGYSNTTEIGLVADAAWTSMTLTGRGSPKVLPNTEYLGDDLRYSDDGPAQVQDFAVKPETASNGELCWKLCVIHPHCNVAVLNAVDVGVMGCYLKHKEVDNPSTRPGITTYQW